MLPAPAGLGFPAAERIARLTRRRTDHATDKTTVQTSFVVTSLPADLADPARIADLLRGH